MAINDREKRSNVQRVGRAWMRGVHPTGTIDEQERIAIGLAYGGNALTPPAPAEGQPQYPSGWLFHDNC